MNISFRVATPCDFLNDDLTDIEDIVYDVAKHYFKENVSIEVESATGNFSTNGKASANMVGTATIDINVGVNYIGDRDMEEDVFISENSAAFEEFIAKLEKALSEMIESIDILSYLPDANVILHNDSIFVEMWNGQKNIHLDWSAPTVEFIDDIEDTLSDLFYF